MRPGDGLHSLLEEEEESQESPEKPIDYAQNGRQSMSDTEELRRRQEGSAAAYGSSTMVDDEVGKKSRKRSFFSRLIKNILS